MAGRSTGGTSWTIPHSGSASMKLYTSNNLLPLSHISHRHTWGACLSTSLGSVVHELGHCFDLVHTDAGIMARGFDDIDRYFTLADSKEPRSEQQTVRKGSSKLTVVRFESRPDVNRFTRFTKISQINPGSELLGKYYHKQDNEQMRSAFGGCFFKRQCALLLFYHR